MADHGLLLPGADLAPGGPVGAATDDVAVLAAMLSAEQQWTGALVAHGAAPAGAQEAVAAAAWTLRDGPGSHDHPAARDLPPPRDVVVAEIAHEAALTGNPVVPLVRRLRAALPDDAPDALRSAVHTGLTSQDVVDTAIVTVVRDAATLVRADLARARTALATLATEHRTTPVLARTLAQAAVPTTFGARAAVWLQGVAEADRRLAAETAALPVAYGGAAGTLDKVPGTSRFAVVETWAARLGLAVPAAPWHVTRYPATRAAGVLAEVCAALGKLASDVLTGVREGELAEPASPGRGTSSTMAHKRNPVLSVLVRRSALAAPHALAQVLTSAGLAVDERPDGAWHAEWPALRDLARHTASAAALAAELVEGLAFDRDAALRNLRAGLGEPGTPGWDTGVAEEVVDRVLARYASPA